MACISAGCILEASETRDLWLMAVAMIWFSPTWAPVT